MEGRGRRPASSDQSAAGQSHIEQLRPTRREGAWRGAEAPPATGAREPMGEWGGRGPAGGTCGRARVRVGPAQAGWDREQRHRETRIGTAASGYSLIPKELNPPPPQWSSPTAHAPAALSTRGAAPVPTPPHPGARPQEPGGAGTSPPQIPPIPVHREAAPERGGGGKPRPLPPSDADRVFAQKCQELGGFIRPLQELLEGLQRGRFHRGLSPFQQSLAMDRLHRIIGVLQKPHMGSRYLPTLLQVEGMLRLWFPHVTPKPGPAPRRRPSPRSVTPDA